MIATLGKYLAAKLLTEAFITRVCLATARHLARKSENKLDDELVSALSEALKQVYISSKGLHLKSPLNLRAFFNQQKVMRSYR